MAKLIRMTQEEYDSYFPGALKHLADEIGKARAWPAARALEAAKKSFSSLFPEARIDVTDQYVFNIVADQIPVGILHFGIKRDGPRPEGFVWDIEVKPQHRGKGYGYAAMRAMEDHARELGIERVGLNVFGHNTNAIRLYERLGFRPAAISMTKTIQSE